MPRRLREALTFVLAGLAIAVPGQSSAQYYGRWHGGYAYRPAYVGAYRAWGYGRYPGYYGYYGYPRYYGHYHYGYWPWVGVAAPLLGYMLTVAYPPPPPPPPPPPVVIKECPDGSTIPAGHYCPAPPVVAPAPAPVAPPPPAVPQPAPERG